MLFQLQSTTIY